MIVNAILSTALECAVIALVYHYLLIVPGGLLSTPIRWIKATIDNKLCQRPNAQVRVTYWLKPLLSCAVCLSGQLAFWRGLFLSYDEYPFHWLALIAFSMLTTFITSQWKALNP